ncbi:hypothetical protein [Mycobacterium sp. AZCC_0083]|uniref:hypothetical protein n=1 Tax=Mycobacterium sp. AZCC_0083 TaxID=2735882 RepID=UPI001618D596|nr:hypothetical protein [Mycobacterium sp. AZCC_0083]MBB5164132.1 hypothetical protein [Mycobacterium sp. AZCC_0083]
MARVRTLAQGNQAIRAHETEVDCFYNVINQPDGTRLLHLSTFGSDYRQSKPKSSQTIQIDEDIARELIDLLESTFPQVARRPRD